MIATHEINSHTNAEEPRGSPTPAGHYDAHPFSALTAYTLYDVGFIGVFEHQLASSGGWQVFTDLAIALTLGLFWLVPDAKKTGRDPRPYIVITLIAGSFGPLLYWVLSKPTVQTSD